MNLKKFLAGVLACCVVGGALTSVPTPLQNTVIVASAVDESTFGKYESLYYENYGDHIGITGCDNSAAEVVIPAEIDGLPVTTIVGSMGGPGAFSDCDKVTSITFPDTITSIGANTFWGTPWLEAKQAENPLVIVNGILFSGHKCSGDIVIPDNVTSISETAFWYNENITSITMPDSVTSIGYRAFFDCSGLTEITIPNSVTSIDSWVFSGCSGLTEIIIPDSVTSIGSGSFVWCESLTSITIPDSVTSIGSSAFGGTPWLEAKQSDDPLVIVNGILIDGTACSGDVVIPNNVTSIGDGAFEYCYELTEITIPDSVTRIGVYAFYGCSGLKEITIPDSVISIENGSFSD